MDQDAPVPPSPAPLSQQAWVYVLTGVILGGAVGLAVLWVSSFSAHGAGFIFTRVDDPEAEYPSVPIVNVSAERIRELPVDLDDVLERANQTGQAQIGVGDSETDEILRALNHSPYGVQPLIRYQGVVYHYVMVGQ